MGASLIFSGTTGFCGFAVIFEETWWLEAIHRLKAAITTLGEPLGVLAKKAAKLPMSAFEADPRASRPRQGTQL